MWSISRSLVRRRREAGVLFDRLVVGQRSQVLRESRFLSTQLPRMNQYGGGGGKGGGDKTSLPPKLEKLIQTPPLAATPLPKRHSRREPPAVCKDDWKTLNDSVQNFVNTPVGHLYSYEHFAAQPFPPPTEEGREIAWNVANTTVQQVEYWIRGYASRIPGTIVWKEEQRAILVAANDDEYVDLLDHIPLPAFSVPDAVTALKQIEALVQRLIVEGNAYMHVRADRCNELHQNFLKQRHIISEEEIIANLYSGKEAEKESDFDEPEKDEETVSDDIGTLDLNTTSIFTMEEEDQDPENKDSENKAKSLHETLEAEMRQNVMDLGMETRAAMAKAEEEEDEEDDDEDQEENLDLVQTQHKLYCNQFASPGPTMTMFMIWLDALAVCAPHAHERTPLAELCHPLRVERAFVEMYLRHLLDGGDLKNQCEYTVANLVGFNATIRACSNLPKQNPELLPDKELRDSAIMVAFSVFDTLVHSKHVSWNAATFRNMLKLVDLFFAPGTDIKGNVSVALLAQAQRVGMVNESVLRQFLVCQEPSNSPHHEAYMDRENLRPNADGSLNLKESWQEYHMQRRWHPADDTY